MLIPKKNRVAVYSYLFKEGVMVCKKDPHKPKHGEVDVPNLHAMKLLQSMTSRGYTRELFSWQWYYYYLTDEGIEYLRDFLHLPAEIVPATLKKTSRPAVRYGGDREDRGGRGRFGDRGDRGDRYGGRDGYRRDGAGKEGGAPGGFQPGFRGGFGRGGPRGDAPRGGYGGFGRGGAPQ